MEHDSLARFPDPSASEDEVRELDSLRQRIRQLERILAVGAEPLSADPLRVGPAKDRATLDNVFFRQLFENSPDGIVLLGTDDRVVDSNRGFEELFGYPSVEARGRSINELIVPGEGIQEATELSDEVLRGGVVTLERSRRCKDGSTVFVRILGYPIFEGERLIGIFGIYSDISFRVRAERQLRLQGAAMNSAANAILITDRAGEIEWMNPSFNRLCGYTEEEVLGKNVEFLDAGSPAESFRRDALKSLEPGDLWRGQAVNRHKDGHLYTVDQTVSVLCEPVDRRKHFVIVQEDITARLETERRLKRLAGHDFLTDLPNRYEFTRQLGIELTRAQGDSGQLAVLLLDIDQFKDVNDAFGHSVGDELLVAVAKRLRTTLRDHSLLGRFGGDEFALLQTDIDDIGNVSGLARRLIEAFTEPLDVIDRRIHVGVSIGIAVYPPGEPDARELIKSADLALYQAKSEGRSTFRFYVEGMDREVRRRMRFGQQLHGAIGRKELFLEFQPQVEVESRRILGFEALLRWRHPEHGLVSPGDFVPIAEASGLIVPIGEWVLRRACAEAQRWRSEHGLDAPVAVNVSAVQFKDPQLCDSVLQALAESGLPPQLLEIELTEGLLMQASDSVHSTLQRLRDVGVRLSLDDFGKGYSSLGYLGRFPLDKLKIDGSFVRGMESDKRNRVIVGTIALLGRKLGLEVIAEGVENKEQVELLRKEGCEQVQGFYFSRPLSTAAVNELIEAAGGRLPV